eukprot:1142172-Pelagomonas_calceolata.AAC.3
MAPNGTELRILVSFLLDRGRAQPQKKKVDPRKDWKNYTGYTQLPRPVEWPFFVHLAEML